MLMKNNFFRFLFLYLILFLSINHNTFSQEQFNFDVTEVQILKKVICSLEKRGK